MDGSSATRASSSSSTPQQAQQAQQPQRPATREAARPNAGPVGKPFAGILAASVGHRAAAAPFGALRGRPTPSGSLLANAARRAAGGATPGATPSVATKAKHGEQEDDGAADPDARGAHAEVHQAKTDDRSKDARDLDLLDPAARQAALLAPPLLQTAQPAAAHAADAPLRARTMEELLPALVKRIAWAGDKHRGTVHLELGAGAYAGTKITVHADAGKVRVELSGHEGPELDRLRTRLDERLRGHGLDVESVS